MQQLLSDFKKAELEELKKFFLIYRDEKAIRHLFQVTCGMDSMVIGEDEILGQVKEAYDRARKLGTTKYLFNTLFQAAITCAKKIKTDTKLSKTPISIGTLVANEIFHYPKDRKKVLIIGLTGKMGTIILKNIYHRPDIEVIGTSRSHNSIVKYGTDFENITMIDYQSRYLYMEEADIIISTTASPHYTITYHELSENIREVKDRLFIDLAVPMDIDKDIVKLNKVCLYDIDYFEKASQNNSLLKEKEIFCAQAIMEEQLNEVLKELYFHSFIPDIPKLKQVFEDRKFESLLYEIRDKAKSEELHVMLKLFRELI
jgi:glutamyl-tRNA reductase